MTRLGFVRTRLGVITLHHKRGRYFTRQVWTDNTGRVHKRRIRQSPESARWWYRHCAESGHTRREWPEVEG